MSLKSDPIDIKKRQNSPEYDHSELTELFNIKMELTDLIDRYIQAKVDLKLKKYYSDLSIELANQVITEIDKSTSKAVDKFMKQ